MVHALRGSSAQTSGPVRLLVIGRPQRWPETLVLLSNQNAVELQCMVGIHEAAAQLALAGGRTLMVLIDPEGLSRREWEMLAVVKRHVPQPIYTLPSRARHGQNLPVGILPWEEAERVLWRLQTASTPTDPEGNKGNSEALVQSAKADFSPVGRVDSPPHNGAVESLEKRTEIPVASEVVESYDESKAELLSDNEIRALLGP